MRSVVFNLMTAHEVRMTHSECRVLSEGIGGVYRIGQREAYSLNASAFTRKGARQLWCLLSWMLLASGTFQKVCACDLSWWQRPVVFTAQPWAVTPLL